MAEALTAEHTGPKSMWTPASHSETRELMLNEQIQNASPQPCAQTLLRYLVGESQDLYYEYRRLSGLRVAWRATQKICFLLHGGAVASATERICSPSHTLHNRLADDEHCGTKSIPQYGVRERRLAPRQGLPAHSSVSDHLSPWGPVGFSSYRGPLLPTFDPAIHQTPPPSYTSEPCPNLGPSLGPMTPMHQRSRIVCTWKRNTGSLDTSWPRRPMVHARFLPTHSPFHAHFVCSVCSRVACRAVLQMHGCAV